MSSFPSFVIANIEAEIAKSSTVGLTWPSTLIGQSTKQNQNKLVVFGIYRYVKGKIDAVETEKPINSIILPMPDVLNNNTEHNYESYDGGVIASAIQNSNPTEIAKTLGLNALNSAGALSNGSLGNARIAFQQNLLNGTMLNPRSSISYSTTALRVFNFSYMMIATSAKESVIIDKIIKTFTYHSLPDATINGNFLKHPEFFKINFFPEESQRFLFYPNPCVLKSINVTYNGNAAPVFFHETQAPVEIRVDLIFQEIEMETKRNYAAKSPYAFDGFGSGE